MAENRSLTSLDLSRNLIMPDGGKALALKLSSPAHDSLTSLNLSHNHLRSKVWCGGPWQNPAVASVASYSEAAMEGKTRRRGE